MLRNPLKSSKPTETPAQMLKRVQAEADAQRVLMQLDAEKREHAEKIRIERVAALSADAETAKTENSIKREKIADGLINYGPLVIITTLAVAGQFGYMRSHLEPTFPGFGGVIAGLVALGLESIALFLGLHAMKALRRKDSAAGLLFAATIVSGLVSYMNFENFADQSGNFTHASWAFGLFSFIGPFVWRIKIRSDHRDELAANDEIDVRGLKLPRVMWIMHPVKSFKVYRHAAWTGERDLTIAVKEWETGQTSKPAKGIRPEELDMLTAMIENIRIDLNSETDEHDGELPPANRPKAINAPANGYPTHHAKWNEGVAIYSASVDSGTPMKVSDLATELGMTNRALAGKIKEYVTANRKGQTSVNDDGSDLTTETA